MSSEINLSVSASRYVISAMPPTNSAIVTFIADSNIDTWECRATKATDEFGEGVGILVDSGDAVEANTDMQFTVSHSDLTMGDGDYRISIYAQANRLGEPKFSFDYDGYPYLAPFVNVGGVDYVYLAELEEGDFITATAVVYFYDGVDVIPVYCNTFYGFQATNRSTIVLGDINSKISGFILGGA